MLRVLYVNLSTVFKLTNGRLLAYSERLSPKRGLLRVAFLYYISDGRSAGIEMMPGQFLVLDRDLRPERYLITQLEVLIRSEGMGRWHRAESSRPLYHENYTLTRPAQDELRHVGAQEKTQVRGGFI